MALTLRTNGSSGVNLITAQWWNDYYNLMTGVMTDQIVTLQTDLLLLATNSGSVAASTLGLLSGTNLSVGLYDYITTFVDNNGGESSQSQSLVGSITTTTNNQKVALSAIATGPTGTVKRNVYRTKVGGGTYFLLTTLNDNVTTTYTDTTADASLPATQPPANPSFGGTLIVKNPTGVVKGQIFNNGAIYFDGGTITSDGSGNLTAAEFLFSTGWHIKPNSGLNDTEYWNPQSGSANGHVFITWGGSAKVTPFSIGGQFESSLSWIDNSGDIATAEVMLIGVTTDNASSSQGRVINFTSSNAIVIKTQQTGSAQGVAFGIWNGSANVVPFSVGGQFASASSWVDTSGNFNGGVATGIPTTRNGAANSVPIYTGTSSPASPPTGAIWIKA